MQPPDAECQGHTVSTSRAISAVPGRGTLMKRSIFLWVALVSQPVPAVAGWLVRRTDGQGKLDLDVGHRRGDPNRDFKFWVYPRKQRLVNRQWDTHEHPRDYCAKYRVEKRLENGVFECQCLDVTPYAKKLRTGVWVAAPGLAAVGSACLTLLRDAEARAKAQQQVYYIWRAAPGAARSMASRTALAIGVGFTSVIPSVYLAFVGSPLILSIYLISSLQDGFFTDRSAARAAYVKELWFPLAAYMALLLSAPLVALQCVAFRFLKWWPRAMASLGAGLTAACCVLYVQHLSEQHKLEQLLETTVA